MNGTNISLLFFGYTNQNNPYSRIMLPVLKTLCKEGANIEVFSLKSNDQETAEKSEGVKVKSCPTLFKSKLLNYLVYCSCSFFYVLALALKNKNTIFIVPTTPPVLLGFVVSTVKLLLLGRIKWLYHVQDIHPEINCTETQERIIDKVLKTLDRINCKSADLIVTLSNDMQTTLVDNRLCDPDKIVVLNNFLDSVLSAKDAYKLDASFTQFFLKDRENNRTIFVYSGNVGPYQNLVPVVELFIEGDESAVLYIIGGGKDYDKITRLVSEGKSFEQVRFFGEKSFSEANLLASLCDYGVVSLAKNISKYVYPSKLGCYLSLGLPVACFLEKESKVASDILSGELGVVLGNAYEELTKNEISELFNLSGSSEEFKEYLKVVASEMFNKESFVGKFFNCMERINAN